MTRMHFVLLCALGTVTGFTRNIKLHQKNPYSCPSSTLSRTPSHRPPAVSPLVSLRSLDWGGLIDQGYLITCPNGDPGGARLNSASSIIQSSGLGGLVSVKEFATDDDDRIRGCYNSHIAILNEAKKELSGTNFNVLVMEDNVSASGALTQDLLDRLKQFQKKSQFDMIHLAYIMYVPGLTIRKTENENVVNLKCGPGSALGTTAYIIGEKAVDEILAEHEKVSECLFALILLRFYN